ATRGVAAFDRTYVLRGEVIEPGRTAGDSHDDQRLHRAGEDQAVAGGVHAPGVRIARGAAEDDLPIVKVEHRIASAQRIVAWGQVDPVLATGEEAVVLELADPACTPMPRARQPVELAIPAAGQKRSGEG